MSTTKRKEATKVDVVLKVSKKQRLPSRRDIESRSKEILPKLIEKAEVEDFEKFNKEHLHLVGNVNIKKYEDIYSAKHIKEEKYVPPPTSLINGVVYQVEELEPGRSFREAIEQSLSSLDLKELSYGNSCIHIDNRRNSRLVDFAIYDNEGLPRAVFMVGYRRTLPELMKDANLVMNANDLQCCVAVKYYEENKCMLAYVLERINEDASAETKDETKDDDDKGKAKEAVKMVISFGLKGPTTTAKTILADEVVQLYGVGYSAAMCEREGVAEYQIEIPVLEKRVEIDLYRIQQALLKAIPEKKKE